MSAIKEITVFSVGDANDLSTWSNVPYFFTKNLEQKGIKVNRVNIEENKTLFNIYKYTVFAFFKLLYRNSNHTYFRSSLNYSLTNKKIKKALEKYSNSDAAIFLTFSFSVPALFKKKVVLFGDWTYLYYIDQFKKHSPYWFEKGALQREKEHIEKADLVLGLFPLSSVFIKENYTKPNVHYLGNVINANYSLDKEAVLSKKINSRKIIFIGNRKYLSGAKQLIAAFKGLNSSNELHLIGLNEADTRENLKGVYHHGYLDKGNKAQNETYYQLLSEAALIVNTNEGWGAISSVIEAMYFFTPVITTPYKEYTEIFGMEISFGNYSNKKEDLAQLMTNILDLAPEKRKILMQNAHEAVKDLTWKAYTDRLVTLIGSLTK